MTLPNIDLPVRAVVEPLLSTLEKHANVILEAPPGAGKTTWVPLAILQQAKWLKGKILVVEPRQLAVFNTARQMAQWLGESLPGQIGYRTRQESRCLPSSRIELITEGVFLRMLQNDPSLDGIDLVIFDEFHERSLQLDLSLALVSQTQQLFRDDEPLRLLLMSATMDGCAVAELLDDAPVITCSGRSFPVDIHYLPMPAQADRWSWLCDQLEWIVQRHSGGVLVFLPGVGEIERAYQRLQPRLASLEPSMQLLRLHGRLPVAEQKRAIQPASPDQRKLVLATNVAETSVTITDVRVVVDMGLERLSAFQPRTGMTELQTRQISQMSATQRTGRAGRVAAGVCYRLWSAEQQGVKAQARQAEILRADLAPLVLELAQWGAAIDDLPWLDLPPVAAWQQAVELLQSLQLLQAGSITAAGEEVVRLGLSPRLGHMLQVATDEQKMVAILLATLLDYPQVLRHERSAQADLSEGLNLLRLAWLKQPLHGVHGSIDRPLLKRALNDCQRLAKRLQLPVQQQRQLPEEIQMLTWATQLAAAAYPDRVALNRASGGERFLLSGGRGACLRRGDRLGTQQALVVLAVDWQQGEGRILAALPASRQQLLDGNLGPLLSVDELSWDGDKGAFSASCCLSMGALVLNRQSRSFADVEVSVRQRAWRRLIEDKGIEWLPMSALAKAWLARLRWLQQQFQQQSALQAWCQQQGLIDLPDLSDVSLLRRLDEWLLPFVGDCQRRQQLAGLPWLDLILADLDWGQRQLLQQWLPERLVIPSGRQVEIDYTTDGPVLAAKLQELFGWQQTPTLLNGQVALTIHLLSPARRPVQITQDLAHFWRHSYHEVKKDLKGRYPKHPWPDDPLTAIPAKGTKKQNAIHR